MDDFTDSQRVDASSGGSQNGLNTRILRSMAVAVAGAALVGLIFAPWRVTTGLILGGGLSLLSYRWMENSIHSAFKQVQPGERPRLGAVQYILRYFVVGLAFYFAYQLNLVSLPAALIGLCSFVIALFVEAFREFYFIIVHREEIS
ncbi:MAG TPA: ATP synthase subunit I [Pyrinomonadaceae bacterium]